jgi:hypothetical protein
VQGKKPNGTWNERVNKAIREKDHLFDKLGKAGLEYTRYGPDTSHTRGNEAAHSGTPADLEALIVFLYPEEQEIARNLLQVAVEVDAFG